MKVLQDSPDRLLLDETPWVLALMLTVFILIFAGSGLFIMSAEPMFGLVFAVFGGGIGAVVLIALVQRLQIILDRAAGTVTIRRKSMLRYDQVVHALEDVSHAELETTIGSKGTTLARPVLVLSRGMSAGRHPLISAYSNLSGPPKMVEAINRWLGQQPRPASAGVDSRRPAP
tara:strand:- start:9 stop:527 length:519 start_codon:yes stop_codon:yes gene_type:complete